MKIASLFSMPFLCSLAVLAAAGLACQAGEAGFTLSGTMSLSQSAAFGGGSTNYFRAEFGTNRYLIELFDQQSNLLSQARYDGNDVSYWWGAADPNASSTVWVTPLASYPVQGPPIHATEEMIVRPLLWSVPGLSPRLINLFHLAKSNPDFLEMVNSNQYPHGFDKSDLLDPDHHLAQRQFVSFDPVDLGGGKTGEITNTVYRAVFTHYTKAGESSLPLHFTIVDLRMSRFLIRTNSVIVDHAGFGPLPPLPELLDGLPRRSIAVIDYRSGHSRNHLVDNAVKNNELAPDFTAMTLAGQTIRLSDYRGKYVLLDFWATWCGPCIAELPIIKSVFDSYGKNPRFALIGMSLDTDSAAAAKFVQAQHMEWTEVLLGDMATNSVTKAYGVTGIPKIFLIGPDGRLIARELRGPDLDKSVAGALDAK
jgi:peroxiredoxin